MTMAAGVRASYRGGWEAGMILMWMGDWDGLGFFRRKKIAWKKTGRTGRAEKNRCIYGLQLTGSTNKRTTYRLP